MKALVTGGYFDRSGEGVVWLVDFVTGRADVFLRWTPPEHLRVPTKGFAGGSIGRDKNLYVAAHAALVRVSVERATVTGVLHQPCMNDLHHVATDDDRLFVSNTGLGAVDVFGTDGMFHGSHSLLPAWANAQRIDGSDFDPTSPPVAPGWSGEPPSPWTYKLPADGYHDTNRDGALFHQLKVPDHLHVNHVARVNGRVLATCFVDGSIRDLTTFAEVARLDAQHIHDGVFHNERFFVTTIDGRIVVFDAQTWAIEREINTSSTGHVGWCRGLYVDDQYCAVGLTEVVKATSRWAHHPPEKTETSVLLLDAHDGRLVARVDLTDSARNAKIYSILPLP